MNKFKLLLSEIAKQIKEVIVKRIEWSQKYDNVRGWVLSRSSETYEQLSRRIAERHSSESQKRPKLHRRDAILA